MKVSKSILYTALGFCALSIIGAVLAPKVRAAVRAALVEVVIPSKPFFGGVFAGTAGAVFGPGTGTLGVSAITFTNPNATTQLVSISSAVLSGSGNAPGSCDGATGTLGGISPTFFTNVPANSTVHLTYPTPIAFTGQGSNATCILAQVQQGSAVFVYVNGFLN